MKVEHYNSTMIWAAENGHQTIVDKMIEFGADDYNGALVKAIENDHQEIVIRMIAKLLSSVRIQ